MPTSVATLIQRTRRFVGDWPELDTLGASLSNSATTVTVSTNPASGAYTGGWLIQVGTEAMRVRTASSVAGTITVLRGAEGTTAASLASGVSVLIQPRWLDVDYLDALNAALDNAFPMLYAPVVDESVTAVATTYEYTVPNLNGSPIPYLRSVWIKVTGDTTFRQKRDWDVLRGATPEVRFRRSEVGTVRLIGFGPFAHLALTDSLSALFPTNAEAYLVDFAAQHLLTSGEAQRVRVDAGPIDTREQATRTGSSMAAANSLFQRAQVKLSNAAMPPIPPNVKATF